MTATHTNAAALTIDLRAAHYQMGVRGLHALLTALAGKVVTLHDDKAPSITGHLHVSEVTEQYFYGDASSLNRVGFSLLVRLGESSDFAALGVWQDDEGYIDLPSIGANPTISL